MLDRILSRVGKFRPGRLVVTVAVYPFYVLGLLVGGTVFVVLICATAVAEGFKDGRRK